MEARPGSSFTLRVLGGFELRAADGRDLTPPGKKLRALIACLALPPGKVWPRERLTALLWGDRDEEQARGSLRQALAELRRLLGDGVLRSDRETVALDGATLTVDAEELIRLAGKGELVQATDLYRGDLLDGVNLPDAEFSEWLLLEHTRLHDHAVGLLSRLLDRQTGEAAISTARRLLELDPLREAVHRRLMRLYAARNDRVSALRQYQACRDRLQRELGINPAEETEQLCRQIQTLAETPVETQRPPAVPSRPSVVVLPFVNMSGDPEEEYFSDGLTEDVITDLSQVSALFVAARHSTFKLKGKAISAQQAARDLGVAYILEGSVRRSGQHVRISAQLIDGATGGYTWSGRYDRDFKDVFAVQDEISRSIVEALRVTLLPDELPTIALRTTDNAEAYQYYLMGRWFLLFVGDKRAFQVARRMFAKAIAIDPLYARAYAGGAICNCFLLLSSHPGPTFEEIFKASERALELAPNLSEAHAAKGVALDTCGRFADAAAEFELAMKLKPDSFETHFFYGRTCLSQGLHELAAKLFERASELQPNDFRALTMLTMEYRNIGRESEVQDAARRCLERVEAEIRARPDNASALTFGANALALLGEKSRAETLAARASVIDPDDPFMQYNIACVYMNLGKPDAALDHIEDTLRNLSSATRWYLEWLKHDSDFAPLRSHPRFQALLSRLDAQKIG